MFFRLIVIIPILVNSIFGANYQHNRGFKGMGPNCGSLDCETFGWSSDSDGPEDQKQIVWHVVGTRVFSLTNMPAPMNVEYYGAKPCSECGSTNIQYDIRADEVWCEDCGAVNGCNQDDLRLQEESMSHQIKSNPSRQKLHPQFKKDETDDEASRIQGIMDAIQEAGSNRGIAPNEYENFVEDKWSRLAETRIVSRRLPDGKYPKPGPWDIVSVIVAGHLYANGIDTRVRVKMTRKAAHNQGLSGADYKVEEFKWINTKWAWFDFMQTNVDGVWVDTPFPSNNKAEIMRTCSCGSLAPCDLHHSYKGIRCGE